MSKRNAVILGVLVLVASSALAADLALPAGTGVKMKLETPLSTATTKAGDTFSGRVTEPVMLNGKEVIPVGATIQGHVVRVTQPRRVKGVPTVSILPDMITMPSGERYEMTASVVDTDKESHTRVNDEGEIKGRGHDKRDLLVGGVAVGAGVGVGAAAGGVEGALIGAAIGGGAGAVHWLWRKHSAELPAGTVITMELNRPMQMNAGAAGR